MNIAIKANKNQQKEILQKGFQQNISITWVEDFIEHVPANADAFFDLLFDEAHIEKNYLIDDKLVFFHGVSCTCREIGRLNYVRLNAWPGFINRAITELTCFNDETKIKAEQILNALGWKFVFVKDDYGLIAARIISMIINEAYFALEQNVSSKEQIDIAMKLGTNYPCGPFEWSEKIGLKNVLCLLQKMLASNNKYTISSLLVQESQQL